MVKNPKTAHVHFRISQDLKKKAKALKLDISHICRNAIEKALEAPNESRKKAL